MPLARFDLLRFLRNIDGVFLGFVAVGSILDVCERGQQRSPASKHIKYEAKGVAFSYLDHIMTDLFGRLGRNRMGLLGRRGGVIIPRRHSSH